MKAKKVGLLLTAFLLVGGTAAYAATTITFKYVVNGYAWTPKTTAKPIVSNGTTYLPVGLVKEATGVNITVDATGKVQFGEKLDKVPILKEKTEAGYDAAISTNSKYTNIDGKDYKEVILATGTTLSCEYYLKPAGKYQTLSLDLKALDAGGKVTFKNVDTKEELKSIFVSTDDITHVEFNITDVKNIKAHFYNGTDDSSILILPTSFYK